MIDMNLIDAVFRLRTDVCGAAVVLAAAVDEQVGVLVHGARRLCLRAVVDDRAVGARACGQMDLLSHSNPTAVRLLTIKICWCLACSLVQRSQADAWFTGARSIIQPNFKSKPN